MVSFYSLGKPKSVTRTNISKLNVRAFQLNRIGRIAQNRLNSSSIRRQSKVLQISKS